MISGDFWIKTEEHIHATLGTDICLLPIIISYDKTTLSRNGTRTATPVYVTVANLSSDAIRKDTSTDLVGYVPDKQFSDSKIKDALKTAGCKSITKQKEALKMYGKYIEQEVSIILYSTINIKIIALIWLYKYSICTYILYICDHIK